MNSAEVLIKFKGDTKDANNAEEEQESKLKKLQKTGEIAFAGMAAAADAFAISVAKGGIEYNAQIETYLTRLTTLTGSAEQANSIIEQIKKDALATPFEVSSLTQAESLLLSTGLSAEQSRSDILALGNAIAASGGGNDELQRMAVNLQQIKNVGKASALDIKQFAYAGIDIYGLLADSMGVTREEASKLDVSYDMLSDALNKASSEGGKYYGAMENQSKTYSGAMSNLSESIEVFKGEIAKGLFSALKKIIPQLTQLFDWLGQNKDLIMTIAIPLLTFINIFAGFILIKKATIIMQGLWAVMAANPIVTVIALLAALVAAFLYVWNNCEAFRNFFIGLWESLKNIVATWVEGFRIMIDGIVAFFQGIINFIVAYIQAEINIIIATIQFIVNFIMGVINFIASIPGTIANFINMLITKIAYFKNNVVAFITGIRDKIISTIKELPGKIVNFLSNVKNKVVNVGTNIVKGIGEGITNGITWLKNKIKEFVGNVTSFIKKVFKIGSPSKLMENQIGQWIPKGIGVGIEANTDSVYDAMDEMQKGISSTYGLSPQLANSMNTHYSPSVNVYNSVDVSTDPIGQTVSNIKTFSGGSRNDYNYGMGA